MKFLDILMHTHSHVMSRVIQPLSLKLVPPLCVLCANPTGLAHNICDACQKDLPILSHSCRKCAQFLPATALLDKLCGACLKRPPPFTSTYALFPYQAPITQMIIQLKFRRQLSLAKALGDLFVHKMRSTWYANRPLPQLIIPIPLHPLRLRERGFNQALEIARPIARAFALAIDLKGVTRIKHTAAQSGLPARKRQQNLAHAFAAHRDYTGLSLAVIDDVMTTGHTMLEFCNLLKQKGAKSIDVWCCARCDIAIKAKTL